MSNPAKKNRHKFKIIEVLLVLILLVVVPGVILFLPIKKIECKLASGQTCPDKLMEKLVDLQNNPLVITDLHQELPKLDLPAGYTLDRSSKKLPGQVKLVFLEETPAYKINCEDCESEITVGTHQHLLSPNLSEKNNDIPLFFLKANTDTIITNNQINDLYFRPLSDLTQSLYKLNLVFQNGEWISANEIRIDLNNYPEAIFSSDQIAKQVAMLELIIKENAFDQAKSQNASGSAIATEISEIDLRYNMPVLRTRK